MILGPPRASLHKEMLLTWKLPWWDSKSPKKENLGSGTLGMRTFLILKRTWTLWSDGLAPPEQGIHVERPPSGAQGSCLWISETQHLGGIASA